MLYGMKSALALTISRIFLGPAFVVFNLYQKSLGISDKQLFWIMLVILFYSELSDIFDGIIARRTNQVSDLGKLLDPVADTIFRLSVFFTFTHTVVGISLLWVLLIFYREAIVAAVRNLCAINGYALAARTSGKIKAVIQAITSFIIVISFGLYVVDKITLNFLQTLSNYSVGVCSIYALASGVEYIYANRKYIALSFKV